MPDRWAFIIAVDTYQAELPPATHAETDAAALAELLERHGFDRERQTVLLGSQATRTAVASRLRKLTRTPPAGDALFVFYAGQAFGEDGAGYLTCFDTQPDDLPDTSVPLSALLDTLQAARCERVALFLDPRADLPAARLPADELAAFFKDSPGPVCFASCREDETSSASGALKAGIWAHHLVEALRGAAPRALESGSLLTAASLHNHLVREVPRTLRASFRDGREQTSCYYGDTKKSIPLADVTSLLAEGAPVADPRLQPLKRGVLRAEATARVKTLGGYRKFHRLPDRVNASSNKFVGELAAEDVKADLDAYYAAVKEHLGYKRRDVESSADRGSGFVRTPDFEYNVSVELAPDDPTTIVWRREVSNIRNPAVVLGKPFQTVFGGLFDTLVFEFVKPFDLEAWVDRVEEEMPPGIKLRCASDCSDCEITVAGFTGVIRLRSDRVEIQGGRSPTSKGLVEAFLQFQDVFSARRDLQGLPLAPPPA